MDRQEIKLAGNGGQGIVIASIILADAAFEAGQNVVQSQAYGPEARGGLCVAELITDSKPINFTKVTRPSLLLTLSQRTFDKLYKTADANTVVIVDSELQIQANSDNIHKLVRLPILSTAGNKLHDLMMANIISIGAISSIINIAPLSTIAGAVLRRVPVCSKSKCYEALTAGVELIGKIS